MRNCILALFVIAFAAGCGKDDGTADFERGVAAYAARDLRAAADGFRAAADKNPTNAVARIRLAVANMELGSLDEARAAVEAAIELLPESAEARLLDGQIAYFAKDYERARKDFDAVANAESLSPEIRSQALSARAVMEIAQNSFDRARLTLWRAVRLHFGNASARYHLGHLFRDTYHFDAAALEQFEMAGRLMKDPVRAKAIAHDVIPALRESLRARMASKPGATSRDPAAAAKLVAEGETLAKADPKKAAAKFAEAYAKDPLSYAAAFGCAKSICARAKTSAEIDKAMTAFQDAIDQRSNSQETYRTAARAALNARRPMRTEKFLSQALSHDASSKPTLELYVQTLRRLGKSAEAKLYAAYLNELK